MTKQQARALEVFKPAIEAFNEALGEAATEINTDDLQEALHGCQFIGGVPGWYGLDWVEYLITGHLRDEIENRRRQAEYEAKGTPWPT